MKQAYLLTKQDGSEVVIFDRKRAHGLAGHYGWTVKTITAKQAAERCRAVLSDALSR